MPVSVISGMLPRVTCESRLLPNRIQDFWRELSEWDALREEEEEKHHTLPGPTQHLTHTRLGIASSQRENAAPAGVSPMDENGPVGEIDMGGEAPAPSKLQVGGRQGTVGARPAQTALSSQTYLASLNR